MTFCSILIHCALEKVYNLPLNKNLHNRNQCNNKKASVRGFTRGPTSAYFMIKPPVKTHIFKPSLSPHSDFSKALSAYEISICF